MADDRIYVFDACAIIAFLQGEPGAEVVAEILKNPSNRCLLHTLNACEVYYDTYRRSGEEDAAVLESILTNAGIELVDAIPAALWQGAGKIKAEWRRISLADCLALALAQLENGVVLSTDHHELDPIAQAAVCQIRFIR